MSFATPRRLRFVVLMFSKANMAASQRHIVGNGINSFRALFANSGYSCKILHQNFISKEELNLRTLQLQMLLVKVELLIAVYLSNKRLLNPC